jgi:hypothetical protein
MKTIQFPKLPAIAATLALFLSFTACQKSITEQDAGTGTPNAQTAAVKIYLTDDQSLVFDEVNIDIQKLEIKVEDSSEMEFENENEGQSDDDDQNGHTSGGWNTLQIHPGVYNILKFRNGLDTLFASADFPTNHSVRKVRLTLGSNNNVVLNGNVQPLTVKDKDNVIVIKLSELEISSNGNSVTNFWLDFDAGRSIREHGNELELKPQVKAFRKEKAGSIEGTVLPADASAIVYAINGSDTTTAKPEREGEFKIIGLKAGTYKLLVDATANNYLDKTIEGIKVENKEDAKVGTITLTK